MLATVPTDQHARTDGFTQKKLCLCTQSQKFPRVGLGLTSRKTCVWKTPKQRTRSLKISQHRHFMASDVSFQVIDRCREEGNPDGNYHYFVADMANMTSAEALIQVKRTPNRDSLNGRKLRFQIGNFKQMS